MFKFISFVFLIISSINCSALLKLNSTVRQSYLNSSLSDLKEDKIRLNFTESTPSVKTTDVDSPPNSTTTTTTTDSTNQQELDSQILNSSDRFNLDLINRTVLQIESIHSVVNNENATTKSNVNQTIENANQATNSTRLDLTEQSAGNANSLKAKTPIDNTTSDYDETKQHTNSSVVHLLSNDDIKEYQSKRKEEDEIKIEHFKQVNAKQDKEKFKTIVPVLRKGKSDDDLESNNNINHLQDDIIDDVKTVKETYKPQLIIVSLDGMRYDYPKMFKSNMDNFHRMARLGVSAPFGIVPTYITQTIASHYSIATGLYEESTGIIDNRFYDPKFNESFKPYAMKGKFFGGEPIWITAVRQNLESRVYYWPGSEVNISKYAATEAMKFKLTTPIKTQIDKIIEWTENGTDLCMMYYGQPDFAGHNFGIGSKEMIVAIKEMNYELGILIDYVKQKNINLIVTSDHGMIQVDKNKLVILEDYLDFRKEIVRIPQFGSIAAIQVKDNKLDQVMMKLVKVPYIKCFRKEDIPEHYHYKYHYRIQHIICIPEITSYIIRTKDDPVPNFGIHGYDNRYPKMRPIFYAIGPDFKQNFITHPFENINLYSLFNHLLHIQPAPNNGSIHNLKHILSDTSLSRLI